MNSGHDSQIYHKVSAGSITYPFEILLSIDDLSSLTVAREVDKILNQDTSKLEIGQRESDILADTDVPGPLRNLLSRLNKSPSTQLLETVAEADRGFKGHERVALIEPLLKDILKDGQIPSPWNSRAHGSIDSFFRQFGTKHRALEKGRNNSDNLKNTLGYDPDQEYEVYEYSSDIQWELPDPFQFCRASSKAIDREQELESTANLREWIHVRTYRPKVDLKAWPPQFEIISTPPFPDQTLSPYLLIYSLARTVAEVSNPSKISFETMMSEYGYLTIDDDCKGFSNCRGFSIFQLPSPGKQTIDPKDAPTECWLLVQEFDGETGDWVNQDSLELARKEAKHWWYKQGWQTNSVVFYRREGMSQPPSDASSTYDTEPE